MLLLRTTKFVLTTILIFQLCIVQTIAQQAGNTLLKMPALFSNNMVLQQQQADPIWGTGKSGALVTVQFLNKEYTTTVHPDGTWTVKINTKKSGGPFMLQVRSENETLQFNNVMVGEVWVCSGQSNMEMPLQGWPNGDGSYRHRVKDFVKEIEAAKYPQIRLLQVEPTSVTNPQVDLKIVGGTWRECSPETVPTFASTAYFFAREVYLKTGVPIGLIESAVGGSLAEQWTSKEALAQMNDFKDKVDQPEAYGPTSLYNGMIAPLIPFGIRGVIWYQGEFNANRAYQYRELFPRLINDWRQRWGQGDFPFYYVQLPIIGNEQAVHAPSDWAELREAQLRTLSLPNTAMAVTIDLPDPDLHPANKQDFGHRLALIALSKLYKQQNTYTGPLYKSFKVKNNEVQLFFSNAKDGLASRDGKPLSGFAIAGEDKVFYQADAKIQGRTIIVSSKDVSSPVSVRYAWAQNPPNNLGNKEGLPASPFRTDNWEITTLNNK